MSETSSNNKVTRSRQSGISRTRRKRCPKGTRRNADGKCESVSIHLLGNSKLFQLSFNERQTRN